MNKELKSKIKKIILFIILAILISGAGSTIFERFVLPRLAAVPLFKNIKILDNRAPIIITRREEIRIDSGINTQEVINRARGSLVKIVDRTNVLSGMIVTNDGLIIAPNTGLKSGAGLTVVLGSGDALAGQFLYADDLSGLAFIKIQAKDLPVLNQVISADINPGEALLSLYLDEAQNVAVRSGMLHSRAVVQPSLNQIRDLSKFNAAVQIDPALPESAAGSVVVDKDGSLVGFALLSGRVIRAEDLKLALSKFLDSGAATVSWPKFNLSYQVIGPVHAKILNLPQRHGVVVKQASRGLEIGDFVYEIDGRDINTENSFQNLLFAKKPGEKVKLKLERQNKEQEIEITL